MRRRNFLRSSALAGALACLGPGAVARAAGGAGLTAGQYLDQVGRVISAGPFDATWESLRAFTVPEWYKDAKFGIFIHWGVYAVPGMFSEWYSGEMYKRFGPMGIYHVIRYGSRARHGYKDFIPDFTGDLFDAGEWIELFRDAGARYLVPVAEHHDGFAMYDTGLSKWNAVDMGPGRDVIGELAKAAPRQDLAFGLSSHRAAHWWFMGPGMKYNTDVRDPRYRDFYGPAKTRESMPDKPFIEDWLARCAELVDLYEPSIFYFDFGWDRESFEPYRRKFMAYYYNRAAQWGKQVLVNYKEEACEEGTAVLDFERTAVSEIVPHYWQTDTSVSYTSWGYVDPAANFHKNAGRIIDELVDIVSKNGALLLNIGPDPRGVVPKKERDILLEIGRWLEVNGKAIYKTRPWKTYGEGPNRYNAAVSSNMPYLLMELSAPRLSARDIRFTTRDGKLYAIFMAWPANGKVRVESLGKKSGLAGGDVTDVRLLGSEGPLDWAQKNDALEVALPKAKPCKHAFALEIGGVLRDVPK